jgi:hypothetical protein
MNKILKIFITHQSNLEKTIEKISKFIHKDYVIVVGGYDTDSYENNIIKLDCDDSYCGLPDKIVNLFKFVIESPKLLEYTHFHKLDEDMELIKEIDFELTDYMGMIAGKHTINRNHHIGRCEGHYWNDKPYEGETSDWCEGGLSYIISRKAIECIIKVDGKKYPLEDVMVANILENNGIYPKFTNMNQYYKPNQWYNPIRTYQDFKGKEWREEGIPKWIFRTSPFSFDDLPKVMKVIYGELVNKNPGYQLFYFSDDDCINYIRDYYTEEHVRRFNTLIPGAYKADYFRYLLLYKHGGCYSDYTQFFIDKIDNIITGVDRVFVRDSPESLFALYNAFMCCKSGDKIVEKTINHVNQRIDNRDYGFNTLDVTGPRIFGTSFCEILFSGHEKEIQIGLNNGTKILDNAEMHGIYIVDENGKNIIIKKLHNHFEHLYGNRKHYGQLWHEKSVFN